MFWLRGVPDSSDSDKAIKQGKLVPIVHQGVAHLSVPGVASLSGRETMSQKLRFTGVVALALASVAGALAAGQQPPTNYETIREIPYYGESPPDDYARERCKLDLYHPVGVKDYPTVVWFHGGGLTQGNKSVPAGLKEKGIAVVAVNYRLSPRAKSPAYIQDAAAAVAWTFANIEKYGGSSKRIFVSGASAGGYLTAMIGLDRRWLAVHKLDPDRIAGLAPLSGQAITHFTIRAERGISDKVPIIDELAPLYHVRKDAPPLLLVTGDRNLELLGRFEETAYLWRMLKEVGHPRVELFELQGFGHSPMVEPGLKLLLDFIKKNPGK